MDNLDGDAYWSLLLELDESEDSSPDELVVELDGSSSMGTAPRLVVAAAGTDCSDARADVSGASTVDVAAAVMAAHGFSSL